jgi:hypothetical protein
VASRECSNVGSIVQGRNRRAGVRSHQAGYLARYSGGACLRLAAPGRSTLGVPLSGHIGIAPAVGHVGVVTV